MPELPEVERVRQSLARQVVGRKVQAIDVRRGDVVRGPRRPADLLAGGAITRVDRLGKQLALVGTRGRCVCVHLGMTGSLLWEERDRGNRQTHGRGGVNGDPGSGEPVNDDPHVHLVWRFADRGVLRFRDPRRFGGVWTFPSTEALHAERWRRLGEDALHITPARLHDRLKTTRRPIKSALLDQQLIAGLGNIYVDELLFTTGIHPTRPADTLAMNEVRPLVRRMRTLLQRAIAAGGSTFRNYVDSDGEKGSFQQRHRVYGRGEQPCLRCRTTLAVMTLAGRTTVFCTSCQKG